MSTHVVHFSGLVNGATCQALRNTCLQALQQKATELRLHFSSEGGSTFHGFALYGFLRSLPVPLITHNIGNVESIAVVVFLAGARRLTCPHGRFLLHALHWDFGAGSVDHARLREYVSSLNNDLDRFVEIFDRSTQGARERLDVRVHLEGQERIVTASAAVASGIAHGVADATIPDGAVTWWVNSQ